MNRTVTLSDFRDLIKYGKDIIILDVRRESDINTDKQMIPGAIHRDPEQVEEWSQDLPKDKEIVIYCARGGSVSNKILDKLLEKNLNARYIEGGFAAWKEATGE